MLYSIYMFMIQTNHTLYLGLVWGGRDEGTIFTWALRLALGALGTGWLVICTDTLDMTCIRFASLFDEGCRLTLSPGLLTPCATLWAGADCVYVLSAAAHLVILPVLPPWYPECCRLLTLPPWYPECTRLVVLPPYTCWCNIGVLLNCPLLFVGSLVLFLIMLGWLCFIGGFFGLWTGPVLLYGGCISWFDACKFVVLLEDWCTWFDELCDWLAVVAVLLYCDVWLPTADANNRCLAAISRIVLFLSCRVSWLISVSSFLRRSISLSVSSTIFSRYLHWSTHLRAVILGKPRSGPVEACCCISVSSAPSVSLSCCISLISWSTHFLISELSPPVLGGWLARLPADGLVCLLLAVLCLTGRAVKYGLVLTSEPSTDPCP